MLVVDWTLLSGQKPPLVPAGFLGLLAATFAVV